ncbi:MAG: monoamine oxidase [Arenicella sp.]|jgi:monoamine oxidase
MSMAGSHHLQGGLTSLIDALVDRIVKLGFGGKLHLYSTVFRLEKVSNKVCLNYRYSDPKSDSKTELQLSSKHVAMALPARIVLDNIEIHPGLNADRYDELEAVETWMACLSKVVVEYARPFWRDAGFSGDVISQLGPMSEIHDASSDSAGTESQAFALSCFLGVSAAERNQHAQQLPNLIVAQLVTLFGDQAKTPINITIQD